MPIKKIQNIKKIALVITALSLTSFGVANALNIDLTDTGGIVTENIWNNVVKALGGFTVDTNGLSFTGGDIYVTGQICASNSDVTGSTINLDAEGKITMESWEALRKIVGKITPFDTSAGDTAPASGMTKGIKIDGNLVAKKICTTASGTEICLEPKGDGSDYCI